MFSTLSAPRCYNQVSWSNESIEFCKGGWEEKIWTGEAEESPLLEAFVRERLVKAQEAEKMLSGCCGDLWIVEIRGGAVIACISESCV
jgi:hypothetical protein